ncbi:LIM domain-containing protein [Colletotrichum sublineola]|uniref:Putative LIM domain-containing protein n=1 Tax=Colletotrichum sublineola TaxID=1173701 RepID=A0A066XEL5_COLSU|nr:LIM domain-containing protein [Colletotrichum sublineola]KDN67382.1 putative LIM domain-containing protein [Colletotrichum sublineola]
MALPRESTFMPTIKCSSCGRQVEISMMGEHVCSGPGEEPSPPPARPDSIGSYDQPPPRDNNNNNNNKYGRMAPPTLDTSAANLPYSRQGQLTPISTSTGSISISPKTPNSQAAGRSDDYFQPQIANDYNSNQQSRRPGGYGGFDDGEEFGTDQMYPNEPKKQAPSLLQRMNTIAPGPFELGKRPGARPSAKNAFGPTRQDSLTPDENAMSDRPLTSASNNSFMSSGSSNGGGIAPPRPPRKNGYGGFGPPGTMPDEFEPETFVSRAGTFPRPSEPAQVPLRTPSAPGDRPDRLMGEPSRPGEHERKLSMGPDTSRPPPPRTSLLRPTTAGRDGTSLVDLANEFGASNPYHTPSASTSSGASLFSHGRQASSQSSSQSSPANPRPRRKPSDVSSFDNLMNDIESSMAAMQSPSDFTQPPAPQSKSATDLYPTRPAPPPVDLRNDPAIQGSRQRARSPLATPDYNYNPREPMDRRNQHQRQPSDAPSVSSPHRNRPSRGNCKSCGEAIKGKSISSADGRLTGRYHKTCFVCTTCREPFSSAEFYVHNDRPYCELHYHKLNGSLCGTCGRGIEGQYLEDEERVKYHVGCFRCGDCGMSLSNGYFEVNGKAYCERDAWRRMQPPPRMANGDQRGRAPGGLGPPGGPGQAGRRPSNGQSGMRPPVGLPRGQRMAPGAGLAPPMPRMNKRMTRLGMM